MSFASQRMYEKRSISAMTSYELATLPPYLAPPASFSTTSNGSESRSSRFKSVIIVLFLAFLSLATFSIILSEIVLSYPRTFLSLTLGEIPSGTDLVRIKAVLDDIEYHTRANASVFAFGALVFMWYKIFVGIVKGMLMLRRYLRSSSSLELQARTETSSSTFTSRFYFPFLLAVIVINDSIYNRPQSTISSSLRHFGLIPPVDVMLEIIPMKLMLFLPSFLTRFIWMAIRALPVCAIEVTLVILVLRALGWLMNSGSGSSSSSKQDLEQGRFDSEFEMAPPYSSTPSEATPAYLEAALVHLYYFYDEKSFMEKGGVI